MSDRYEIPNANLATLLWRRGWLRQSRVEQAQKASPTQLVSAVRAYQKFFGLTVDGWAGPVTERSLRQQRFCGLPDRMRLGREVCRWPMKRVTWVVTGKLPHVSDADQKAAYDLAWSYWADVCGIKPAYAPNSRTANVLMGSGNIDRAGGTLAWSELPCNAAAADQLEQRYDDREPWVIASNPGPGQIDLVRVAAHEIGHALGLPHLAAGNLLAPTYDPDVRQPQAGDITEMVRRYGKNADGPPPPADSQELTIQIRGAITSLEIPGFRISKLPTEET